MYKEQLDKIKGRKSEFYFDYWAGMLLTEETIEQHLIDIQEEGTPFSETVEDLEPVDLKPVKFIADEVLLYYLEEVRDDFPPTLDIKTMVDKVDVMLLKELQEVLNKITATKVITYIG